ncbi:twin-arginine translocation signal domain-containing protein [Primorskyibacter sp. S87]|uniref:twin-arginine translocation signal domain-containing protein n=1 Tax=Primorskyibacter sp. S87 TaxID=3415126 RepID=UPI003C7E9196
MTKHSKLPTSRRSFLKASAAAATASAAGCRCAHNAASLPLISLRKFSEFRP